MGLIVVLAVGSQVLASQLRIPALEWGKVAGRVRRVVPRLVIWEVPVTMAFAAVLAGPLLGMSAGAAVMTGAILVVSGPTVVPRCWRSSGRPIASSGYCPGRAR